MEPTLSNLKPPRGSRHRKVRVGRGMGSKTGQDCPAPATRDSSPAAGTRAGQDLRAARCRCIAACRSADFRSRFRSTFAIVNVDSLNAFAAGDTVTPELLMDRGIVRAMRDGVKVLGDGELKVAVTVRAHAFSKSAEEKITKAGGKAEVL